LRSEFTDPTISAHGGRVFKRTGDGLLVEFRSVIEAVRCAIEIQTGMPERNAGLPSDRRIEFRIGVHLGDIVEEADGDLMGDGVNIAARLEGICAPNDVGLSGAAYDQIRDKVDSRIVDLGERNLKNIRRPVRAYRIVTNAAPSDGADVEPAGSATDRQAADRPSLAALPFQNLGGDPETDYFADGVVEDIITALSGSDGCSSSPGTRPSFTRTSLSTPARSGANWASAISSRVRSAKRAGECAFRDSSSRPLPAAISGPIGSMATSPRYSSCRIVSR
jgi:adenylate cyclase